MNFKNTFLVLILISLSCAIVNNDNTLITGKLNIFGIVNPADSIHYIIVDTVSDISAGTNDSYYSISDAEVLFNGEECKIETLNSELAKFRYYSKSQINGGDECSLMIVRNNDTLRSYTKVPGIVEFKNLADSSILSYTDSTSLFWSNSNTVFYQLTVSVLADDSFRQVYFDGMMWNDTFVPMSMLSAFFPDTILADIMIMAIDSNYLRYQYFDRSSFEDNYGLFGSLTSDLKKGILFIRQR